MSKIKGKFKKVFESIKIKLRIMLKWFITAIKRIAKVLLKTVAILSIIAFVIVPFLHNTLDHTIAQWMWYPSFAIFLLLTIIDYIKNLEPILETHLFDFLGKWGFINVFPVFGSIFVFNYYNIDYIWLWVIFGIVAVYVPIFFLSLQAFDWMHNQRNNEEKQKASINTAKNIVLYWLFDLFYMSVFNNWLIPRFVFGILAIVIIFFNLADVFLHGAKSLRFFIVLELIFGLVLSGYLIFIIPDSTIQNIVLTISASLIGGIFTLLGVAWTIKKGDADRQVDLRRIEDERKEEERKKHTPYIRLASEYQPYHAARVDDIRGIDFNKTDDIDKIQNNIYYAIKINHFTVKNISSSNIILNGIYLNNDYYPFSTDELVECNNVCQIQFPINHWFAFAEKISSIRLVVSDILDNKYTTNCKPYLCMDQEPQRDIAPNNLEYSVHSYTYTIENISLPVLLKEDSTSE